MWLTQAMGTYLASVLEYFPILAICVLPSDFLCVCVCVCMCVWLHTSFTNLFGIYIFEELYLLMYNWFLDLP